MKKDISSEYGQNSMIIFLLSHILQDDKRKWLDLPLISVQ